MRDRTPGSSPSPGVVHADRFALEPGRRDIDLCQRAIVMAGRRIASVCLKSLSLGGVDLAIDPDVIAALSSRPRGARA
jgi:hypothetical protein